MECPSVPSLQLGLEHLCQWARKNNTAFNSDKFVALRYGQNEFHESCNYVAGDGTEIEDAEVVRDLGVNMTSNADFLQHIETIAMRARGQAD